MYSSCPQTELEGTLLTHEEVEEISSHIAKKVLKEVFTQLRDAIEKNRIIESRGMECIVTQNSRYRIVRGHGVGSGRQKITYWAEQL